ncbi:DUF805 domain-containing protein [Roseicyclus sp. F158]|uniref:DUF805 domain-containing protein n=1 Tax=Tropicimonas omnivorans TaxID=3075590 RepID=A0ABU3DC57_9RHOB|nr:DUF805 domain-containing protein [Roseicyclus sp. F158]MDT0681302.1 DUF805 domain-containing protein [Roseicyclus sp. F158]
MSMEESVRTCLAKYVVISGRARRSEYWWFALFVFAVSIVLNLVETLVLQGLTFGLISLLWSLAVLLPGICVGGRRLHDRDMSAWWLLLALIPGLGAIILLVLFCLPGTDGPNRFGPDPLGRTPSGMAAA